MAGLLVHNIGLWLRERRSAAEGGEILRQQGYQWSLQLYSDTDKHMYERADVV